MKKTTLVATLTTPPSTDGAQLRELSEVADWLEVRGDLVPDIAPDWLRDRFPGGLIYTLRSQAEGGAFEGGRAKRQQRLATAAAAYDLVDLEAERDLAPELLVEVSAEKRLVSWHGSSALLSELKARFEHMASTEARFYKMIPEAVSSADGIRALALVQALRRQDVVAFASGPSGSWTRFLAPRLGSPLTYGSVGDHPGAPGQLSIARLCEDFGMPFLPEVERLYGIVGRPVLHSLSPRLHNGAYRALGLPYLYVPFHAESFGDFWIDVVEAGSLEVLGFPLHGLSVTAPYKEVALAVSGASSPRSQHVGAANTLVFNGGVWEGETTDPEGVVEALEQQGCELQGCAAAVVGCGGAGRAAAYGLQLRGAQVTLVNRGEERGRRAAIELALPFVPLAELEPEKYDVLVNATSLGHDENDPLPFAVDRLRGGAAVVDLVYGSRPTPLLSAAHGRGLVTVSGLEALFHQALEQFQAMTGRELNPVLARELLRLDP